jgi:tRNA-specific 2-thiouridylase
MLPEVAKQEGVAFDYFATGHYAKVEWNEEAQRYFLLKPADLKKDQTYFLYRLSQEQLSKVIFPLGELTKKEVRSIAGKIDLQLSGREESQDFYSGDYKELLDVPEMQGSIINRKGRVLGAHKGIWNYTIGQRKGLGVAWSEPLYVIGLDKEKNDVVVGTRDEVLSSSFIVDDLNWIAFEKLERPMQVTARIRSASAEKEAEIEPVENGKVKVTFKQPNDSITPGQSAVFYLDDKVAGGGTIESVIK